MKFYSLYFIGYHFIEFIHSLSLYPKSWLKVTVLVVQSYLTLCDPLDCRCQAPLSMEFNSPGKSTGVDCHSVLQGIFPTLGSNPDLLHCRQILYSLSHQGSPRIQEWVAYPFSRGSSWPRNRTGVSHFAGGFFTSWATREALLILYFCLNKSYTIGLCSLQIFLSLICW